MNFKCTNTCTDEMINKVINTFKSKNVKRLLI